MKDGFIAIILYALSLLFVGLISFCVKETLARSPYNNPIDPNRDYKIWVLRCLETFPSPDQSFSLTECIDMFKTGYKWSDGIVPSIYAEEQYQTDQYKMLVEQCLRLWKHPSQLERMIDCIRRRMI